MASILTGAELAQWELKFEDKLRHADLGSDPAHDLAHFSRVVTTSKRLAKLENARLDVVIPAAWLHDLVNVPKNDPRRSMASRLSAAEAKVFLAESGYPSELLSDIGHAIESHSFSANITPLTVEARIVQDADRLDGLGAIGVARCFAVAGLMGRRFYEPSDPFGKDRPFDDYANTVDHFYVKLFKTADTLQTEAGRAEGVLRAQFMRIYLEELGREVTV